MAEQKLTVLSQKAEMKRKLAVVTQDMYNNLDLLVGSSEFVQVKRGTLPRPSVFPLGAYVVSVSYIEAWAARVYFPLGA